MGLVENLKLEDIDSIKLDSEEDSITVNASFPVGDKGQYAEFEEKVFFGRDTPKYLRDAATQFAKACVQAVRGGLDRSEVKCDTCTGACCYTFEGIHVTPEDVMRLASAGNVDEMVDFYAEWTERGDEHAWTGYCGTLKVKPLSFAEFKNGSMQRYVDTKTACINLGADGCQVYEHRPDVCRSFSAYGCETFVEDPAKIVTKRNGKTTLKVI